MNFSVNIVGGHLTRGHARLPDILSSCEVGLFDGQMKCPLLFGPHYIYTAYSGHVTSIGA